jgi:hypothetical protein
MPQLQSAGRPVAQQPKQCQLARKSRGIDPWRLVGRGRGQNVCATGTGSRLAHPPVAARSILAARRAGVGLSTGKHSTGRPLPDAKVCGRTVPGPWVFVLWALALCRLLFCKHRHDRILLYVRIQVSVAAALLFSLVTYEIVDDPLVDSLARQGRDEGVPENVPAP